MDRLATVTLNQDADGQRIRLGQIRYQPDAERGDRCYFKREIPLPSGSPVLLESEWSEASGIVRVLVQFDGREVLQAICRWSTGDSPFLRIRLGGAGLLTLQFVNTIVPEAGPVS